MAVIDPMERGFILRFPIEETLQSFGLLVKRPSHHPKTHANPFFKLLYALRGRNLPRLRVRRQRQPLKLELRPERRCHRLDLSTHEQERLVRVEHPVLIAIDDTDELGDGVESRDQAVVVLASLPLDHSLGELGGEGMGTAHDKDGARVLTAHFLIITGDHLRCVLGLARLKLMKMLQVKPAADGGHKAVRDFDVPSLADVVAGRRDRTKDVGLGFAILTRGPITAGRGDGAGGCLGMGVSSRAEHYDSKKSCRGWAGVEEVR